MLLTSLFGRVKNLDGEIATNTLRDKRLYICKSCPKYRSDFVYLLIFKKKNVSQCGVCKCSLYDKAFWLKESCPNNLWKNLT